ncbi:hypothetical protein GWI33_012797 [Rhynchophorus ferrugineus]|uniref:Uncharacterized protein n=1 Tax=Rhynchophorus ferrugineus TaxID=354439 RepID=A0A834I5V7_RHYFE|nr:hypothetical protein GWI33_012797 [Rhynchophorus ferrugineus]
MSRGGRAVGREGAARRDGKKGPSNTKTPSRSKPPWFSATSVECFVFWRNLNGGPEFCHRAKLKGSRVGKSADKVLAVY